MIPVMQNVQMLNVKSVYNTIQTFLELKGDSSSNTRMAYEKDIKNFFMTMLGKELSQLTVNDLGFTKADISNYRTHLKGLKKEDGITPKYKHSSINRFIESVRSLFTELEENDYDTYIKKNAFSFDNLPENDSKRAGELTEEEYRQMEQTALTLENGLMKFMLISLAVRTSIRLSALLNLKWNDITYINHGEWEGNWLVNVIDKGNKEDNKIIMDNFYQQLLSIKIEGQDKLFMISDTAVNKMIKRLCKLNGISEDRNITFHSLKGYGINFVIDNGGNLEDAKVQANHSSSAVTSKHYLRRTKNYSMSAGVLIDSALDTSPLDGLDKDQLLGLIRGMNKTVQQSIMKAYKNR